jgi:hypothetical protein
VAGQSKPMKESNSDSQDTIALDEVPISKVKEFIQTYQEAIERRDQLEDRVAELEKERVHPRAVQKVLQEYGLSVQKASEIVETVKDVNAELREDTDE